MIYYWGVAFISASVVGHLSFNKTRQAEYLTGAYMALCTVSMVNTSMEIASCVLVLEYSFHFQVRNLNLALIIEFAMWNVVSLFSIILSHKQMCLSCRGNSNDDAVFQLPAEQLTIDNLNRKLVNSMEKRKQETLLTEICI